MLHFQDVGYTLDENSTCLDTQIYVVDDPEPFQGCQVDAATKLHEGKIIFFYIIQLYQHIFTRLTRLSGESDQIRKLKSSLLCHI